MSSIPTVFRPVHSSSVPENPDREDAAKSTTAAAKSAGGRPRLKQGIPVSFSRRFVAAVAKNFCGHKVFAQRRSENPSVPIVIPNLLTAYAGDEVNHLGSALERGGEIETTPPQGLFESSEDASAKRQRVEQEFMRSIKSV